MSRNRPPRSPPRYIPSRKPYSGGRGGYRGGGGGRDYDSYHAHSYSHPSAHSLNHSHNHRPPPINTSYDSPLPSPSSVTREVITRDHDDGEEGELKEETVIEPSPQIIHPPPARPRIPSINSNYHQRHSSYSPTTTSRSPRTPEVTAFDDKPGRLHTKTRISNTSITKEIVYPDSPPKPAREPKIRGSATVELDDQLEKLRLERKQAVETGRLNAIAALHALNEVKLFDIELSSQKMKSTICDQQCLAD